MRYHQPSTVRVLRLLVVLLLGAPLAILAGGSRAGNVPEPSPQMSALVVDIPSSPRWFVGSDHQTHLVYELWLMNPLPAPVTVTSVDVLDGDTGESLMRLEGATLLAAMSLAALPDAPDVILPLSSTGVVWFDVPLAADHDVPAFIYHQLTVELPSDLSVPDSLLSITSTPVPVDERSPVVLGPPLAGPQWTALGSCCDGPHRRALYPIDGQWFLAQRYAIDFNLLEADNRPGTGDPLQFTSFPTYGQPVLAVTDALVVEAVDRYPDLLVGESREELTAESAGGNRIVLDLGDGRFAVYAHLQEGSVRVQPGDLVKRGQQIASAGSSGTTGGPHLHFQVTDRPSVVAADGLPYVFDAFEVTGQTPPLTEVVPYYDSMEPIPVTTEGAGPRREALPLGGDVVTFQAMDTGDTSRRPHDLRS
jgi:hypothetical protein